jgi:hypothetical protein
MSVEFFGRPGFTKSSPDPHAFDTEAYLWVGTPELAVTLFGTLAGGYLGWRLDGPGNTNPTKAV